MIAPGAGHSSSSEAEVGGTGGEGATEEGKKEERSSSELAVSTTACSCIRVDHSLCISRFRNGTEVHMHLHTLYVRKSTLLKRLLILADFLCLIAKICTAYKGKTAKFCTY